MARTAVTANYNYAKLLTRCHLEATQKVKGSGQVKSIFDTPTRSIAIQVQIWKIPKKLIMSCMIYFFQFRVATALLVAGLTVIFWIPG